MTNSAETDRDVSAPRTVTIPGSDLYVEVRLLRRTILAELGAKAGDRKSLDSALRRLAEVEDW